MKTKRILSYILILSILAIAFAFSIGAFAVEDGSGLKYTASGAGYLVSGISSDCGANVTIPSSYGGKPVIGIAERVFENQENLESVTLPSTLTSIGKFAFSGCSKLKTINLPNGLTTISLGAFYNCISLANVNLPNSISDIGDWAFFNCRSLASISIPSCTLGKGSFSNCSALSEVYLSYGIKSLPMYLFEACYKIETIEIPATVESIGQYAFVDNYKLNTIILNNPSISIASNSFFGVVAGVNYTCNGDWSSFNKDNYGGTLSYKQHAHVEHYPYKAATNTTAGNIEYWYCLDCSKYFNDAAGTNIISKSATVIMPIAYIKGDVNADGIVNGEDVYYLLRYTILPGDYPVSQPCDFDGSGIINGEDVYYLLRYTVLPDQYPLH